MYKSLIALLLIFSATALQAENNYSGFYLGATLGYVDGEDKGTESDEDGGQRVYLQDYAQRLVA